MCGIISLILQIVFRILLSGRLKKELFSQSDGVRALIYGSGITAQQVVDQMLYRSNNFVPIGFLDDDMTRKNFMFRGRKVLGTIDNLEEIARNARPEILVVTIANISSASLIQLEKRNKFDEQLSKSTARTTDEFIWWKT